MIPVEAVYLYKEGNQIGLRTDAGNYGMGTTIEEAVQNMHEGAPGYLFLDTADFLLVAEETTENLPGIKAYLKSGIYLCMAEKDIDMEKAAAYLSVHRPSVKLKEWNKGTKLEKLYAMGEQMYLE